MKGFREEFGEDYKSFPENVKILLTFLDVLFDGEEMRLRELFGREHSQAGTSLRHSPVRSTASMRSLREHCLASLWT